MPEKDVQARQYYCDIAFQPKEMAARDEAVWALVCRNDVQEIKRTIDALVSRLLLTRAHLASIKPMASDNQVIVDISCTLQHFGLDGDI